MTAPKKPQTVNVSALNELGEFVLKSGETPEERASRLKREEAEAEHKLSTQAREDAHKRQISLMAHRFAFGIVGIAFLTGVYVVIGTDPKTGLPDKALAMIAGIALALASYVAGSKSK